MDFSQEIASTFIHEAGHCILGKRRKHHNGKTIEPAYEKWIMDTFGNDKFPVEKRQSETKDKKDIVSGRYELAMANLKKASTRLKRAKTIHDKWNRKVRYYEKKMAAKGARS